jgi:hypothetical protein
MNDKPNYPNDDGSEYNPDLIPKPDLCISCKRDELREEETLCNLNRMDQQGDDEFVCGAYEIKTFEEDD